MDFQKHIDYYEQMEHDPKDPMPWHALFLDLSIPFDQKAKGAFLYDSDRKTRQYLLPFMRVLARLSIVLIQILKIFTPRFLSSSKALHYCLYWGMKYWITPEANFLILRHFVMGSEVLQFIKDNVKGAEDQPMNPLKPFELNEVKNDLFLEHDLNLYNFIIRLNKGLRERGEEVERIERPDFSALTEGDFPFENFRNGWTNFLDLNTAIEIFTPVYQFFLTDGDFWRASHSLQFDEVIGIYVAKILGNPERLVHLNNKHPMVPESTLRTGHRLLLHGLSTEILHAYLVESKRKQRALVGEKVGM